MINLQNVNKSFGDKHVLQGISLDIQDGDTLCIIGKSGSGKSVLLKHIVGLLYPDSGDVLVDGSSVLQMRTKELFELRQKIGYVFQGAALFDSFSVFENVTVSLWEHGKRDMNYLDSEAKRVLSAVGLLPNISDANTEHFQKEWEILKDKMPSDLSGGMKKRVGVARALVGNPDYIFYDEPSTGLDPVNSEQVDNLIKELDEELNITSIVITHDMFSVFRIAKRVVMIHDGQICFIGSPDELRQSNKKEVVEFLERYS